MASMRASGICLRVAAVRRQVPVNASRASRASKVPSRVVTRANATTRRRRRFGALAADDDDGAVAEEEEEEEEVTPLDNVCFVLCRPKGTQNIGGIARVMQNFGVTDLRIHRVMASGGQGATVEFHSERAGR